MDRGAWQATFHGVTKSPTQLKWLGTHTHLNAEFQRIARRDKKTLSEQCKDTEENNRMGKTIYLFKKLELQREHFMQKWAQ